MLRSQKDKAQDFRELHHGKKILILPNAWDVPSARVFENEGFPAVATSSAGLTVSLGYPDGEVIGRAEFVSAVRRIAKALSLPLFAHATKKLFPIERQFENVKAIRRLGDTVGVPLVINARTDALRFGTGDDEAKFEEAIRRAIAYRDAGADCVYPIGMIEAASISRFVKELDFPINVMVRKGLPPVSELERFGVARVSFGPSASYAAMGLLKRAAREVLENGKYENLVNGAIGFDELNSLALPKPDLERDAG
jgi:2-methylisocitrate lyase-like PEP mutase family enzyme